MSDAQFPVGNGQRGFGKRASRSPVDAPMAVAEPTVGGQIKRTAVLSLVGLGAGALTLYAANLSVGRSEQSQNPSTLAALNQPAEQAQAGLTPASANVGECVRQGYNLEFCNAKAQDERDYANAPTFASKAECEAVYGEGNCTQRTTRRGGVIVPALLAYKMGKAVGVNSTAAGATRGFAAPAGSGAPATTARGGFGGAGFATASASS